MQLFIHSNGTIYKAEEPKFPDDMERTNASQEQIDALPDDGSAITFTEHEKRINLFRQGFSYNKNSDIVFSPTN